MTEAVRAEQIVENEVEAFCSRMQSREVVPTIVALQEGLEKLRRDEIERYRKYLGSLDPDQQEAFDRITRSLIKKILHVPIAELKDLAGRPDGADRVELIRKIFNVRDK
jgi:glutamyl-tRNA reductase